VESNSDVQSGTALSGFRDSVAEGHTATASRL